MIEAAEIIARRTDYTPPSCHPRCPKGSAARGDDPLDSTAVPASRPPSSRGTAPLCLARGVTCQAYRFACAWTSTSQRSLSVPRATSVKTSAVT
jgi:hypothetical protein